MFAREYRRTAEQHKQPLRMPTLGLTTREKVRSRTGNDLLTHYLRKATIRKVVPIYTTGINDRFKLGSYFKIKKIYIYNLD